MKVLLVDDHPLFLEGMRLMLASHGFQVVGTARDGLQAIEKARALHPDIVLMDVQMPRLDGLAALRVIRAEQPDIKVLMLTVSAEDEDLFEALKSGASGYLLKTQDTNEFLALLNDAQRGGMALSPGLASRILREFQREPNAARVGGQKDLADSLSARQTEVLTLVAQGLTYKEVGAKLLLTERTIKYHMAEIVARLHMENRDQVLEFARRTGLI